MERLVALIPDADMFFACLANLHKRRLKYERILQTQPIPTIEQVGPRGLLQFGAVCTNALTSLLLWRKWFFDINNRAGQETGYLFEPIIAHAIGGMPFSAKASPIRRQRIPAREDRWTVFDNRKPTSSRFASPSLRPDKDVGRKKSISPKTVDKADTHQSWWFSTRRQTQNSTSLNPCFCNAKARFIRAKRRGSISNPLPGPRWRCFSRSMCESPFKHS